MKFFLTDDTTQVINATYYGNATPLNTFNLIKEQIKIYPNPATDQIYIDSENLHIVEIYSSLGNLIQTFSGKDRIKVNILKNGIYFLKIYSLDKKLVSISAFQKINSR